jgi:hypothetical protein
MRQFKPFCAIVCLVCLVCLVVPATGVLAVGESTVPCLIIPPGARANGMGESFVSIADDATAAWWNAGGMAFLTKNHLSFMHSQLVPDLATDVYYEYFGYSRSFSGLGTLGFSFIYLTYGESIGKTGPDAPEIPFNSWEGALMASYGMNLMENLGFGLSMKFVYADLAPADVTPTGRAGTGSSIALDVGTLWKLPAWKTQVGAAVTNIGPDVNYEDKEQPNHLPLDLRLGASFFPLSDDISNLILTFEIEQSLVWLVHSDIKTRRSEIWHAGAEYRYINLLAGRVGYIYDKDGDFNAPTYGLGFLYKGFEFDYANVPQSTELDRVHRWSLTVTF